MAPFWFHDRWTIILQHVLNVGFTCLQLQKVQNQSTFQILWHVGLNYSIQTFWWKFVWKWELTFSTSEMRPNANALLHFGNAWRSIMETLEGLRFPTTWPEQFSFQTFWLITTRDHFLACPMFQIHNVRIFHQSDTGLRLWNYLKLKVLWSVDVAYPLYRPPWQKQFGHPLGRWIWAGVSRGAISTSRRQPMAP